MDDFSRFKLVGQSRPFLDGLRLIEKFAACHATVLLQGETGTGKELAARALHYLSPRHGYPFIPVNCGALPDTLVESELFGHVRGAFTDARESRLGLIANAEGGTLFLDEIETLSQKAQVVLLRFLQDNNYRPLGGSRQLSGDVRIIAASNVELADLAASGAFRHDLYYRLAILSVRMPPLRERTGDAVVLARHFLRQFARQYVRPECELDSDSIELLLQYDWPGNVRELENLVHREFLMVDGAVLRLRYSSLRSIPAPAESEGAPTAEVDIGLGFRRAKAQAIARFERSFLSRALAESHGNVSRAARLIGKERRAMAKLLRKHSINRAAFQ